MALTDTGIRGMSANVGASGLSAVAPARRVMDYWESDGDAK
jgi:hypothetical protein